MGDARRWGAWLSCGNLHACDQRPLDDEWWAPRRYRRGDLRHCHLSLQISAPVPFAAAHRWGARLRPVTRARSSESIWHYPPPGLLQLNWRKLPARGAPAPGNRFPQTVSGHGNNWLLFSAENRRLAAHAFRGKLDTGSDLSPLERIRELFEHHCSPDTEPTADSSKKRPQ